MTAAPPPHEALAAALLGAERPVVLTGRRLGPIAPEDPDPGPTSGDWSARASLEAFLVEPARFWDYFYPTACRIAAREPAPAHHAVARLQRAGAIWALIAEASDRLHARAGSPDVVEVHGNLLTQRCDRCGERYGLPETGVLRAEAPDGVPRCTTPGCGYPLRPDGTLWNEPLPRPAVERAWELAAEADAFLVLDCDLRTAPISLLPSVPLTRGARLLVVGPVPTQYDRYAELVVRRPSEEVLVDLAELIAPPA